MKNINYIYGKTTDGKPITLDGFRVEAFTEYKNEEGDYCMDIYFKSGNSVSVYGESEDGCEISEDLDDCFYEVKRNPSLLLEPHPAEIIYCKTADGKRFSFDGNAVEFHVSFDDEDGKSYVELHFASGRVIVVLKDLDEDIYPGDNVVTLVDNCICRYLNDK